MVGWSPFTLCEIRAALDAVKISLNPGLDRVEYRLLKLLPEDVYAFFLA